MHKRFMVCLTALVVLASCAPRAITTPISAQTITPHLTIIPTSTSTPNPMYVRTIKVSPEDMDGLRLRINEIISTKNATFGIGIYDLKIKIHSS